MKNIDDLKRKFWKGTSKLDEELELKKHFSKNEKHQIEDELFSYLEHKKKQKLEAPNFDKEVLYKITSKKGIERSLLQKINWKVAAAAIFIFAAGVLFLHRQMSNKNQIHSSDKLVFVDTFKDPQIAYEETKKALLLISNKLNKGNEYTAEISKFSQTQEILRKEK